jgi:predicted acylesterase/phospholipase RssA
MAEESGSKDFQRALILQGGGALGAYEAGVLHEWCSRLASEDMKNNRTGPMFDIVAGASMGAVNASLLVYRALHYCKNNLDNLESWTRSVADLCGFYDKISRSELNGQARWTNSFLNSPVFDGFWSWWEFVRKQMETSYDMFFDFGAKGKSSSEKSKSKEQFEEMLAKSPFGRYYFYLIPDKWGLPATPDTARKYYSYLNSLQQGTPGVIAPSMVQPDMKFLDPLQWTHIFARFDNDPLAVTMKEFWDYDKSPGIKTGPGEPRLLVVAVDVEDCTTATSFDSYSEFTEYGSENQYRIECPVGVTIDHIKASMSTALRYQYPHFEVKVKKDGNEYVQTRHFWDGAYIANTPANEVMQKHRKYWERQGKKPPDLELYIINLYPAMEAGIPGAPDTIQDRQTDIGFHDRTRYGIRVARMRSEYIDLVSRLKRLAQDHNLQDEVDDILAKSTGDKKTDGSDRTFDDLVQGRFEIKKVVYAQREEKNGTAIYGKAFDFSARTLTELIQEGKAMGQKSYEDSQKHVKGNII